MDNIWVDDEGRLWVHPDALPAMARKPARHYADVKVKALPQPVRDLVLEKLAEVRETERRRRAAIDDRYARTSSRPGVD